MSNLEVTKYEISKWLFFRFLLHVLYEYLKTSKDSALKKVTIDNFLAYTCR